MRSKNIAIFLDGTWNQVDDYTNVYLMYQLCKGIEVGTQALAENEQYKDITQIKYYDPGVGTGIGNLSPVLIGGAIGLGLKHNVAQAYLSICRHYNPGDKIYIYGFSRGAYTARTLAGLLYTFGVLSDRYVIPNKSLPLWPLTALARNKDLKFAKKAIDTLRELRGMHPEMVKELANNFKSKYCKESSDNGIEIEFMGLFDTVGSLGIPSVLDPFKKANRKKTLTRRHTRNFLHRNKMPNANFPRNIKNACHALAVDEYRLHFVPTLWNDIPEAANVEQRWFTGAHSNIGGGYPNNLLSNKPLYWIYQQSNSHDLELADFMAPHEDVHLDEPISDSFAGFRKPYKLFGIQEHYRPIYFKSETGAQDDSSLKSQTIDDSVFERIRFDTEYRTQNLMRLSDADQEQLFYNKLGFDKKLSQRLKNKNKQLLPTTKKGVSND